MLCTEGFDVIGSKAGGGTGAVPIKFKAANSTAWLKPWQAKGARLADVAHERIAFRLGHFLSLPVSPVAIAKNSADANLPPWVALSYAALEQPRPWGQNAFDEATARRFAPVLGAMLAFHCWIDDHDHNWNEGNALFELSARGPAAAYFDYSYSLSKRLTPAGEFPAQDWRALGGPNSMADWDTAAQVVEKIEGFPVKELRCIIEEVPDDCLQAEAKNRLIDALGQRRAEVRALLKL